MRVKKFLYDSSVSSMSDRDTPSPKRPRTSNPKQPKSMPAPDTPKDVFIFKVKEQPTLKRKNVREGAPRVRKYKVKRRTASQAPTDGTDFSFVPKNQVTMLTNTHQKLVLKYKAKLIILDKVIDDQEEALVALKEALKGNKIILPESQAAFCMKKIVCDIAINTAKREMYQKKVASHSST